jgi:tetratricopeptide (TPR) repeat protein
VALSFASEVSSSDIARAILEKLVTLDPTHVKSWILLAAVEHSAGGSPDAIFDRMLAACPKDAKAHVARADLLRRTGRREEAVSSLESSLASVDDPNYLRAYLVEVLDELGRKEEADVMLAALEKDAPTAPTTRMARASRALRERRPAQVVEILQPIMEQTDDPRAAVLLAVAQLRLRNLPAATEALDRGFELAGGVMPSGYTLRLAIARAGNDWPGVIRAANDILRNGTALSADQAVAVVEALYETNRKDQARERLAKLLSNGKVHPRARVVFAEREGAGDPARARRVLEEGLSANPRSPALVRALTNLDLKENKAPAALARLDAALSDLPPGKDFTALRLMRARLRLGAGDEAGAEADAIAAFRAAPQIAETNELVAVIAVRRGRVRETIELFEEAAKSGQLPRPARTVLARLYVADGRDAQAQKLLEEVVAEGGGIVAKNELAYLLAKQGVDLERALTLAQEVVQANASQATFLDTLGFAYLQRKLYAPALAQFDRAIELAEEGGVPRAEYHYRRGLALQGLERTDEARKEFEAALSLDPGFSEAQHARASLGTAAAATP